MCFIIPYCRFRRFEDQVNSFAFLVEFNRGGHLRLSGQYLHEACIMALKRD